MKKLFDKDEIWFAVLCIAVYVFGFSTADALSETVGIVHGNCMDDALAVAEMVKAETPSTEIIISDVSPSIGVHSGPGALGLLYYGKLKPQAEA